MGINFPNSPTAGQVFVVPQANGSTGPIYQYLSGAWRKTAGTALRANKLVNPVMQISQERGSTTSAAAGGVHGCDQWRFAYANFTGIQSSRTVLSPCPTPNGTPYCLGVYFGTAFPTLSAGTYFAVQQYLEGNRIADLLYGTALAKWSVLRFWIVATAGTYTVAIRNSPINRSWLGVFTISAAEAGSWQTRTMVVPGDTTGAWATDASIGCDFLFALAASSDVQVGAAGWQAGNFMAVPGQTNAGAAAGWNIFIGDVGWHADPLMTGVAPEFQLPAIEDDMQDCLRYWYPAYRFDGVVNSGTQGYAFCNHYVPMRGIPAHSLVGTLRGYEASVAPNISAISNYNTNTETGSLLITSGTTMIVGRPYKTLVDGQTAGYIAVSARM